MRGQQNIKLLRLVLNWQANGIVTVTDEDVRTWSR